MLVGAGALVANKETALLAAGEDAAGTVGRVAIAIAAVFSTGSAINATLFATARLLRDLAGKKELPNLFCSENRRGMPDRGLIILGLIGAPLAALGTLSQLLEAASLTFLATFAIVNAIALKELETQRWIPLVGAVGASAASIVLAVRLAGTNPYALVALVTMVGAVVVVRRVARFGRRRPIGGEF